MSGGSGIPFTSDPIDFGPEVTLDARYFVIFDDEGAEYVPLGYVNLNPAVED